MLDELLRNVNQAVENTLFSAEVDTVDCTDLDIREKLGLDPRAVEDKLFISYDFIGVRKRYDRQLQYYGGFEYIIKEHRLELGDYVLYSSEACRVQEVHDRYFGNQRGDEDESHYFR